MPPPMGTCVGTLIFPLRRACRASWTNYHAPAPATQQSCSKVVRIVGFDAASPRCSPRENKTRSGRFDVAPLPFPPQQEKPEASVLKLRLCGFHRAREIQSVSEEHHQTSFFPSFRPSSAANATSKSASEGSHHPGTSSAIRRRRPAHLEWTSVPLVRVVPKRFVRSLATFRVNVGR